MAVIRCSECREIVGYTPVIDYPADNVTIYCEDCWFDEDDY